MGVITTALIPAGKTFGPIPPTLTLTDPAFLIGHMTCDNRPDVHTVKLDVTDYASGPRAGEWVPYVQPARDEREQNLEAFLVDGLLHYRATRSVAAGHELLVWYSKEYAHLLGVPELQAFHIKEGGIYSCPYCAENFQYPNSLRAHMRFRCEHRRQVQPREPGVLHPTLSIDPKDKVYNPGYEYLANNFERAHASFFAAYPHLLGGRSMSGGVALAGIPSGLLPSPASSTSSSISVGKPSPDSESGKVSPPIISRATPEKRRLEEPENPQPPKRAAIEDIQRMVPSRSPEHRPPSRSSRSPDYRDKVDQNQNISQDAGTDEEESVSAFRKVEKHSPRPSVSPSSRPLPSHPIPSSEPSFPIGSTHGTTIFTPTPITARKTLGMEGGKNLGPAVPGPFPPRYPLLPGSLPPPFLPGRNYNENLPLSVSDMYGSAVKLEVERGTSKLADIRNIENNNLQSKLQFLADGRLPSAVPLQYYKSVNPMVDKLLQTALSATPSTPIAPLAPVSLTQNWCAKCNATFRMTSDLVYHMRSHHKREFDPMKKRREEKLKCNICGEAFRERHHLTRHMTSHA